MSVRTKMLPTKSVTIKTTCPISIMSKIERYFQKIGVGYEIIDNIELENAPIVAKNALFNRTNGTTLAGIRYRENLTQEKLSELTGIPRRHISEMENDKRPIGKQNAKKLANALGTDYHLFL